MSLPIRTIDDLRPPPKISDATTRPRSPRVLVVEDDPMIIPLLTRALGMIDSNIVLDWASCAEDARSALLDSDYHAVLADFMLADSKSGYALFEDCRALQPKARFAMMSAMPITPPRSAFGFLRKPFSVGDCQSFLAGLLEGTA